MMKRTFKSRPEVCITRRAGLALVVVIEEGRKAEVFSPELCSATSDGNKRVMHSLNDLARLQNIGWMHRVNPAYREGNS
jgi:hypothetical protein